MRTNRTRILKLEQSIESYVASKSAREEAQKNQAERAASEWARYQDHMSRQEFDAWKQNEREYYKHLMDPVREAMPVSTVPGVSQEMMDRRWGNVWARLSAEAKERYSRHHDAYQAVFLPRYVARALQVMSKEKTWGNLVDRMQLLSKVETEVAMELGFNSWGERIPYDLSEKRHRFES